ncbi:hypothetical protein TELCIR_04463 [Teladorsagia circumcincta]|uniref:Cysteine rich repeat-containing domain protein n=1 Tax=Teladorsagia circumcincta TaxID=45464 RepID=A0A2G9UTJ6_TELCI|nr:hypothetical protein TELCIR_04463 [Teladorsagia circumcincta]
MRRIDLFLLLLTTVNQLYSTKATRARRQCGCLGRYQPFYCSCSPPANTQSCSCDSVSNAQMPSSWVAAASPFHRPPPVVITPKGGRTCISDCSDKVVSLTETARSPAQMTCPFSAIQRVCRSSTVQDNVCHPVMPHVQIKLESDSKSGCLSTCGQACQSSCNPAISSVQCSDTCDATCAGLCPMEPTTGQTTGTPQPRSTNPTTSTPLKINIQLVPTGQYPSQSPSPQCLQQCGMGCQQSCSQRTPPPAEGCGVSCGNTCNQARKFLGSLFIFPSSKGAYPGALLNVNQYAKWHAKVRLLRALAWTLVHRIVIKPALLLRYLV